MNPKRKRKGNIEEFWSSPDIAWLDSLWAYPPNMNTHGTDMLFFLSFPFWCRYTDLKKKEAGVTKVALYKNGAAPSRNETKQSFLADWLLPDLFLLFCSKQFHRILQYAEPHGKLDCRSDSAMDAFNNESTKQKSESRWNPLGAEKFNVLCKETKISRKNDYFDEIY